MLYLKIKVMNVKEIIKEVEIFIDENINEFEFIVDINDSELYEIDFNDNSFNMSECCSVFIREKEDKNIEKEYKDNIMKKVIKDNFILYIIL
jgi:hypothetical protein